MKISKTNQGRLPPIKLFGNLPRTLAKLRKALRKRDKSRLRRRGLPPTKKLLDLATLQCRYEFRKMVRGK